MIGVRAGAKLIAVAGNSGKAVDVLEKILAFCKRENFSVARVPIERLTEKNPDVLLTFEPVSFESLKHGAVCVIEYSLAQNPVFPDSSKLITYSTERDGADFTARNIRVLPEGITAFEIVGVGIIGRVRLKVECEGAVSAVLAASASAIAAGIPFADILEALNNMDLHEG